MNKLTYEQEKKLREMKDFRFSNGICATACWFLTIVLIFTDGLHDEKLLIPFGGMVTTIIFLYVSQMINKIEEYKS